MLAYSCQIVCKVTLAEPFAAVKRFPEAGSLGMSQILRVAASRPLREEEQIR
jgi:hypothetical protein